MKSARPGSHRLVFTCLAALVAGVSAQTFAADEATSTLRREHREEAQALREQQAQEEPAPEASESTRKQSLELHVRERAEQETLQTRQLRQQLQSSQIRQLQAPEISASQAQIQLQQFRREREAQRLQRELLRPMPGAQKR